MEARSVPVTNRLPGAHPQSPANHPAGFLQAAAHAPQAVIRRTDAYARLK